MQITIDPAGFARCQGRAWRCALGRGGVRRDKCEGDGATPVGVWRLGRVYYRADRVEPPQTGLNVSATQPAWGWCDDPADTHYNQRVTVPYAARHETLWRDDALYDVLVELHYNTDPIVPGRGSAIFMHVAKPGYEPTEGCVALELADLLELLRLCNDGDAVIISASA